MKKTAFSIIALSALLGIPAHAIDISGITAQGEAAFDYNFLSSGSNPYPASGGALNDQYHFHSAQLILTKETEELSLFARLAYVPTEYTSPAGNTKSNIGTLDQLEVYYKIAPEWSVGGGRLCSTLGFESALKNENAFYANTVAYQGIVPGYNEGMRLRFNPGEFLAVSLSTYNRSTYNQFGDDYTPTKTTELSATGVAGRFLWFAGYYTGTDTDPVTPTLKIDKSTSNIWATYKFSDNFTWSVSYDARTQTPDGGSQIYAQSISSQMVYVWDKHSIGLRYESVLGAGELDALNNSTGAYYTGTDKANVWTLGDKFKLSEHLKVYVEYRHDSADQEVLTNDKGDLTKELHMITLGAVAHF
ncbi:MAG: outer membrane beta-barrel protein [Bdellovibrio sp.]|nr:outer membrane beta-barrel protein [Bdellovibrio sp.]